MAMLEQWHAFLLQTVSTVKNSLSYGVSIDLAFYRRFRLPG